MPLSTSHLLTLLLLTAAHLTTALPADKPNPVAANAAINCTPADDRAFYTTLNATLTDDTPPYRCFPGPPSDLIFTDCRKAIDLFPRDATPSRPPFPPVPPVTFSKTAVNARYRLPQAQLVGSCMAIVEFDTFFGDSEESSWTEIRKGFWTVWGRCVIDPPTVKAGGEAVVGQTKGIKVSLLSPRAPPPSGGAVGGEVEGGVCQVGGLEGGDSTTF